MRTSLIGTLAVAVLMAPKQPPGPTRTFRDVTQEIRDLRDPAVPDKTVADYIAALTFPAKGSGTKGKVKRCHGCPSTKTVDLEMSSEMGTVGLANRNLGAGGRLIARVRNVDPFIWRKQEDLDLGFHDEAYLWVSGREISPGLFESALIHIDPSTGKRTSVVTGRMWYCAHSDGHTPPAGEAQWQPPHKCDEPKDPLGRARPANFHLTSWFACDQGCCVFVDD